MKKGFTLVELIAVIIIIGIIAMITFPIVNNSIQKSKEKALERTIDNIISASYNYSIKNDLGEYHYDKPLDIKTLIDSGYLEDKAINPVNNEELEGCVLYRWDESNNQYEFKYDIECKYDTDPTITLSYDSSLINSYGLVKENMPVTLSGNGTIKYCISDKECEPNEIAGENMYTKFLTNDGINYICALTSNSIGDSETKCANFEIDKTKPVINDVIKTSDEETYISIEVNATDNDEILNYYYSINNREYTSSTKNNFTFTGLSKGTDYTINVYVEDKAGNKSEIIEKVFTTKEIKEIGDILISNPPTGLNTEMQGGLYRFQGTNVNNYICFGTTDKDTCVGNTDRYMYRIIGINSNKQVKLIKKESLSGTMQWYGDYHYDKSWPQSSIYSNVNGGRFLTNSTYMPSGWSDKIATMSWKYGVVTNLNVTAENMYSTENSWTNAISAKIALMYLHDYYYAMPNGNNCLSNHSTCASSWIFVRNSDPGTHEAHEWTMTRAGHNGTCYMLNRIDAGGSPAQNCLSFSRSVRPVFYLNSDVIYLSGTGTASDPFIIQ